VSVRRGSARRVDVDVAVVADGNAGHLAAQHGRPPGVVGVDRIGHDDLRARAPVERLRHPEVVGLRGAVGHDHPRLVDPAALRDLRAEPGKPLRRGVLERLGVAAGVGFEPLTQRRRGLPVGVARDHPHDVAVGRRGVLDDALEQGFVVGVVGV